MTEKINVKNENKTRKDVNFHKFSGPGCRVEGGCREKTTACGRTDAGINSGINLWGSSLCSLLFTFFSPLFLCILFHGSE